MCLLSCDHTWYVLNPVRGHCLVFLEKFCLLNLSPSSYSTSLQSRLCTGLEIIPEMLEVEAEWGWGGDIYHWEDLKINCSDHRVKVHTRPRGALTKFRSLCRPLTDIALSCFYLLAPFLSHSRLIVAPEKEQGDERRGCAVGLPLANCGQFFVDRPALQLARPGTHSNCRVETMAHVGSSWPGDRLPRTPPELKEQKLLHASLLGLVS